MKRQNPEMTKEIENMIYVVAKVMFEQSKNDSDYPYDDFIDQLDELRSAYVNNNVSLKFIEFGYGALK